MVLALGAVARAGQTVDSPAIPSTPSRTGQDDAPRLWIALEGGWAHAFLDGGPGQPTGGYVGLTRPIRLDLGIRLSEHAWVAPFVSTAWVRGETNGLGVPVSDGFRLLIGGELQYHSAGGRDPVDVFGGVGLAFERLVAHSRFESCSHCTPDEDSLIGNGVNLGIRVGILVHVASFLQIGPYVGAQFSWMPGLKAQVFTYPFSETGLGGSSQIDVKDLFPWVEAGLRVVFLP